MSSLTRRTVLLAAPALMVPAAGPAKGKAPDFAGIERACGGRFGACVIDTATSTSVSWRGHARFPFCSSFKVPLAAFALWKVDRRQLQLGQIVRYGEADLLPYAPMTRAFLADGGLSVERLCVAAVRYSDNTAANLLLREMGGPAALTAWMREQGDRAFVLTANEPALNLARFGDDANTTSPRAMAESYRNFVLGTALTASSRRKLADWMLASTTGDRRLRAGLPAGWCVGDKTGTFGGGWFSTIDIGVAWASSGAPVVIAGFLTDTPDTAAAERALAELGRQAARWAISKRHLPGS